MTKDQNSAPRFSFLRFAAVLWLTVFAFGFGRDGSDAPRALFASGMLLLAYFAGVFNPLSPTPNALRPHGWLEWSAFAAAVLGAVLVVSSLAMRLG